MKTNLLLSLVAALLRTRLTATLIQQNLKHRNNFFHSVAAVSFWIDQSAPNPEINE